MKKALTKKLVNSKPKFTLMNESMCYEVEYNGKFYKLISEMDMDYGMKCDLYVKDEDDNDLEDEEILEEIREAYYDL